MLWKISLRGIWLLRRVGFKESEALLLFVILKFKFPRKCTNRYDMIPKRRHPLLQTDTTGGGDLVIPCQIKKMLETAL